MSELTFYEDNFYPNTMSKLPQYDRSKLQLDFNSRSGISPAKRSYIQSSTPGTLLQSPDLKLLKLASPELEKLIIQNNGFITTTPTPTTDGNGSSKGQTTTAEQEQFARGFIEALQKLHEQEHGSGSQEKTVAPSTSSLVKSATWKSDVNANSVIQKSTPRSNSSPAPVILNFPTSSVHQQVKPSSRPVATAVASDNQLGVNRPRPSVSVFPPTQASSAATGHSSFSSSSATSGRGFRLSHPSASTEHGVTVLSNVNSIYTRPIQNVRAQNTYPGGMTHSVSTPPRPVTSHPVFVNNHVQQPLQTTIKVEDGAQVVPSGTPPVLSSSGTPPILPAPIDLEMQEIVKHERKKLRNRLAAQRCRRRKIEREDVLKDRVKELKNKNSELNVTAGELRMQVCELKQKVMEHVNQGCQVFGPHGSDFPGISASLSDSSVQFGSSVNVEPISTASS